MTTATRAHSPEEEERRLSRTDALTGIGNRRHWDEILERTARLGRPFFVLVFDVANLKSANDVLGHRWGDEILQRMGDVIRAESDQPFRIGGDEFGAILTDCASFEKAVEVRNRIEKAVGFVPVTESISAFLIGAAVRVATMSDLQTALDAADVAISNRKLATKRARGEVTSRQAAAEKLLLTLPGRVRRLEVAIAERDKEIKDLKAQLRRRMVV